MRSPLTLTDVQAAFAKQPSMTQLTIDTDCGNRIYTRDDLVTPGQLPFGHPELRSHSSAGELDG